MKVSAKQVFVALITVFVTLGVLFGGMQLYRSTVVASPLMSRLGHINGVTRASINGQTVTVQLSPHSNLMSVYQSVVARSKETLGKPVATINVVSHSNNSLNQLANNAAFVVAQGQATGQFVAMKSNLMNMAHQSHADIVVEMGQHHLYLTFRQGAHVLYRVIPINLGGNSHA